MFQRRTADLHQAIMSISKARDTHITNNHGGT